jgi:hypothetical protein
MRDREKGEKRGRHGGERKEVDAEGEERWRGETVRVEGRGVREERKRQREKRVR